MNPVLLRSACFASLFAAALTEPAFALWPSDPTVNAPVCVATGDQANLTSVPDGTGGAIVFWFEGSGATGLANVRAQHMTARGTADPAWPAAGLLVCSAAAIDYSTFPVALPDGAGGALMALIEANGAATRVRALHVLAAGELDAAWPAGGAVLCFTSYAKQDLGAVSDGASGLIVTWIEKRLRTGQYRSGVYANHVTASGEVDPLWAFNGSLVFESSYLDLSQARPVEDGTGGVIVAWVLEDLFPEGADIFAKRVRADGSMDPAWPNGGRILCLLRGDQDLPVIVSDGAGGAVVAWRDVRGADHDVYANHLLANGTLDYAWPLTGRALCTAPGDQAVDALIPDGAGGAIAVMSDLRDGPAQDLYAQHVQLSGELDPAWPANGLAICTAPGEQRVSVALPDGAGGALVAWEDWRGATHADIYAQHVLAAGANDPAWPAGGLGVALSASSQFRPSIASDGDGGAIVAFTDTRGAPAIASGTSATSTYTTDIYAERVERHGYVGSPGTEVASVADEPGDQGGVVRVTWPASPLEATSDPNLAAYDLERFTGDAWTLVQSVIPDHVSAQYVALAPSVTGGAGGAPELLSVFRVVARNAGGSIVWPSPPDSGYALDNLAPAAPAAGSGEYGAGSVSLQWLPGGEPDLQGYRIYRGPGPDFVPGPETRVGETSTAGFVDPYGAPAIYKVTAVDVHGNESAALTIAPTGSPTLGAGGGAGALAFAAPQPNPATRSASLTYVLPQAMPVRLVLYDAAGRAVRVLEDGPRAPGVHTLVWDLRDEGGMRLGAGLYFARFDADGRTIVHRIITLR